MKSISEVFSHWSTLCELAGEELADLGESYHFIFEDSKHFGQFWLLRTSPLASLEKSKRFEDGVCKVTLTEDCMLDLANLRLNPQEAFLNNRLKLEGSFEQALALNPVLDMLTQDYGSKTRQ